VYALAVARIIRGSLATRLLAAHWTIDETTAMATAQPDPAAQRTAFWATGVAVYTCWNAGTLIGALTGSAIDPQTFGLDAAFPAGFVAMVTPQLRRPPGLLAGILGAVICLVLIPFTPIGVPILCSAAAVLVGIPARTMQVESVPGTAGVP
jgi:predicted branched-subunit amino acid permease